MRNSKQKQKLRNRLDIIASILSLATVPTNKTRIMYRANLSYTQLQKYMQLSLETELLEQQQSTEKGDSAYNISFIITDGGRRFLAAYEKLNKLIEEEEEDESRPLFFHTTTSSITTSPAYRVESVQETDNFTGVR